MQEHRDLTSNEVEPKPPLGSWRRIYWIVAICFFVEVALFYLFTRYYS